MTELFKQDFQENISDIPQIDEPENVNTADRWEMMNTAIPMPVISLSAGQQSKDRSTTKDETSFAEDRAAESSIPGTETVQTEPRMHCSGNQHVPGEWKEAESPIAGFPMPCCGSPATWDNSSRKFCNTSSGLIRMGSHGCICEEKRADRYTYVPDRCTLEPWDAAEFCLLLGSRYLVLIGDSVMQQVATVLSNRVALDFWGRQGDCRANIKGKRSDRLVRVNDTNQKGANKEWTTFVPRDGPQSIVVVSAGPHVPTVGMFGSILDKLIREHDALVPSVRLVWQSQLGGGCAWPGPARKRPNSTFWTQYARTRRLHNYDKLELFDQMARRTFPGPNRRFFDLSPIALRLDGRIGSRPGSPRPNDCAHFCHPGPLDDLVPRLYLQLLRDIVSDS